MIENPASGPNLSLEELAIRLNEPVKEGPPDIISGLLPRQGQLVISGMTNIGKSLCALEIVSALATGVPLWGHLEPTLRSRKVLYVLGEHYREVIQRLWQTTKLPITDEVYLLGPEELSYDKWLVLQGRPNLAAINKFKKWADGVDFIVFDPLSSFIVGVDAENDNIQMRLLLDTMSLISQSVGASSLVLAHQGKPVLDQRGYEHSRKSYAIRGASAIEDAATNIFYMEKGSEAQSYELKLRKYKGIAPDEYRLLRDRRTLTHKLLGNKPLADVQKIEAQTKISRLQTYNPNIDFRTAVKIVAAVDGVAPETIERHLGLKPEVTEGATSL